MEIIKLPIAELNNAVYNPRKDLKPSDAEYIKLKNSIEHFGYVDPIIVNKNGNIVVGGHQRLKVLKDLGYTDIDVVYVELNEQDEKALNVALNKISGDWDADKLEDLIRELSLDTDFDVELTGFDWNEIETLFNGADDNLDDAIEETDKRIAKAEIEDDNFDTEVVETEDDKNERGIKLGDVYKLGRHTLMCGDSTDKAQVLKLIGDNKVDLLMTDPPYPQEYNLDGYKTLKDSLHKYAGMKEYSKDELKKQAEDIEELSSFDCTKLLYLKELDIPLMFIFTSKDGVKDYLNMFDKYNYDILTWCKTNPTPFKNCSWYPDTEYMLMFRHKKEKCIWNNNLTPASIYKKYYIGSKTEGIKDNGNEKVHPTMKPLNLLSDKMQITSNENSVVMDLFGGSGSTLIVAEQLNRICLMMEYEPKYMNVIIDRWEKYTGLKAEKLN